MPLASVSDHGIAAMLAVREATAVIDPQQVPSDAKTIITGQYLNCVLATMLIYDTRTCLQRLTYTNLTCSMAFSDYSR